MHAYSPPPSVPSLSPQEGGFPVNYLNAVKAAPTVGAGCERAALGGGRWLNAVSWKWCDATCLHGRTLK